MDSTQQSELHGQNTHQTFYITKCNIEKETQHSAICPQNADTLSDTKSKTWNYECIIELLNALKKLNSKKFELTYSPLWLS